jgi:hypothetical protein
MNKQMIMGGVVLLFSFQTSCIGHFSSTSTNKTISPVIQSDTSPIPQITSFFSTTTPITSFEPSPIISNNPPLILPHSLYYLGYSTQLKNYQIFRLERNGNTVSQVTNDPNGITSFDIFSNSTGIVYFDNKYNLIFTDIQGRANRILVSTITSQSPALSWSPDGKTIAYQNGGVFFYSLVNNSSKKLLLGIDDPWIYTPRKFSPDGSILLVSSGRQYAFYNISSRSLTLWSSPSNDASFSCGGTITWSSDSKKVFIADGILAGGTEGMRLPGLWRYTTDGKGMNLLPSPFIDNKYMYNKPIAAREEINTGDLFFLFSPPETGIGNSIIPYFLVRSGPDSGEDRTILRPEAFYPSINFQTLWSPDGSFLIIVQHTDKNKFDDLILIPIDSTRSIITLLDDASTFAGNLRWGP